MKILLSILLSLVLHILFGWEWSILGGFVAGFWTIRRSWLAGMITVASAWALLIFYNLIIAFDPTNEMFRVTGELVGGLPPAFMPLFTVLVGCILGALSGFVGKAIGALKPEPVVVKID